MSETNTQATQATPAAPAPAAAPAQTPPPTAAATAQAAPTAAAPSAPAPSAKAAETILSADAAAAPATPQKYELKLPESSLLAPEHIAKVEAYAKEKGLSNEQAQGLLEHENATLKNYVESQKASFEKQSQGWVQSVQADKEIGGEAFKQNVETAHRVIRKFATDDFRKALDESGLGNHPELVRTFVRIGKAMSDDQLVLPGAEASGSKRSISDRLYGGGKE